MRYDSAAHGRHLHRARRLQELDGNNSYFKSYSKEKIETDSAGARTCTFLASQLRIRFPNSRDTLAALIRSRLCQRELEFACLRRNSPRLPLPLVFCFPHEHVRRGHLKKDATVSRRSAPYVRAANASSACTYARISCCSRVRPPRERIFARLRAILQEIRRL